MPLMFFERALEMFKVPPGRQPGASLWVAGRDAHLRGRGGDGGQVREEGREPVKGAAMSLQPFVVE